MAIRLTQAAAKHVRNTMAKRQSMFGLRLGVKTSGCSGFAYTVDYAESPEAEDEVYEQDGIKVVVDRKSLPFLTGMEVDYVRDGLNQRFEFRNPNVTGSCGCGESFSV